MSTITLEESVRNGLVEFCKEREMIGATIFDENGNVILNQGFEQAIPVEQLKAFTTIFNSEEDAFSSGILLFDTLYDVHRFYVNEAPSMVYGRKDGDKSDSRAAGILRVSTSDSIIGQPLFIVTNFKLPCLTTRAITHARDFARQHLMKPKQ